MGSLPCTSQESGPFGRALEALSDSNRSFPPLGEKVPKFVRSLYESTGQSKPQNMPGTRESKELENKSDALPLGDVPKDGEIRTRDCQMKRL